MEGGQEPYALPADPALVEVAGAVRETGHWAWIVDRQWELVYVTDDLRHSFSGGELVHQAVGQPFFGEQQVAASHTWRFGPNSDQLQRRLFSTCGGLLLHDAGGDRDAVRAVTAPLFHDLIDGLKAHDGLALSGVIQATSLRGPLAVHLLALRVRDARGQVAGTVLITKPPLSMATVGTMLFELDLDHLAQMQRMGRAARRPATILFADLEGSSALARRLSTNSYFALGRRLVSAADRCVIDAGGLVGRHVGDGVVAFFLVETLGIELRTIVYTTNAIESLNARFRKSVRHRGHFPTEQAALKVLYLVATERRPNRSNPTGKINGWKTILNALTIHYGDPIQAAS